MGSTRTFNLPQALATRDDGTAQRYLEQYYADGLRFTGSAFDTWDSTGTRDRDANRFTADDLLAIRFLSVTVPPRAAHALLVERAQEFTTLLEALGDDRDLVDEDVIDDDYVGWKVMDALRSLKGIGPTTASKLLARKRPRLRPIWDTVVAEVTGTQRNQWEPVRAALNAETSDGTRLHDRLVRLGNKAGLAPEVTPLRVLDVIAWMEGTASK